MFGMSVPKIVLLGLVVLAVWYGFKYLSQASGEKVAAKDGSAPKNGASGADAIEDMVRCPSCGAYRSKALPTCSTPGCASS